MPPSKSSLLELTHVLHLLGLAGAASLSWRVPEQLIGSTHHHGGLQWENKTTAGEQGQCLGVPRACATPPAPTASEQAHAAGSARRGSPSANRCALRKGRNGARARVEKGHPSCNLTFWVCCLRKQMEMLQCLQCLVGKVVSQVFSPLVVLSSLVTS